MLLHFIWSPNRCWVNHVEFSSDLYNFHPSFSAFNSIQWTNQREIFWKKSLWFTSILCPTYWYWGQQVLANLWSCKVFVVALSYKVDTWPRQGTFCASYNTKYIWWFYMSKQAHILCVKYIIHIRTWKGVLKTFFSQEWKSLDEKKEMAILWP